MSKNKPNKPNIQPKKEASKPNNSSANKPNIQPKKEAAKPVSQPRKETPGPNKPKTTNILIGGVKYPIQGNKVGAKEFGAIATGTGRPLQDLRDTLADKGFRLNESGKQYYQASRGTVNQGTSTQGQGEGEGTSATGIQVTDAQFPWQQYEDLQLDLGELQKGTATESERIRGQSNVEIAKINADASNYGYDRQLEGTKYATDSEERWRQAVATIEGDKKARLQEIINAGLKDVADIEGSYSLKNVEKKGEWDYKTMGLRTQADKDIARMDANQKMYNLLGIAFG